MTNKEVKPKRKYVRKAKKAQEVAQTQESKEVEKKSNENEFDPTTLTWVSMRGLVGIPKHYIKEVNDTDLSTDEVINYASMISKDPRNIFFVFVDDEWIIKGFMWASILLLKKEFYINMLCIDENYRKSGSFFPYFMKKIKEFIRTQTKGISIDRITGTTSIPDVFIKHGFKQSKKITLEYDLK